MTWQQIVVIVFLSLSVLTNVARIGKEAKPTTPGVAVAIIIVNAILIALVVSI